MANYDIKPGPGRPKGAKNQITVTEFTKFLNRLEELEFDPLVEAIALFRDKKVPARDRVILLKDILSFTYPRRKTVVDREGVTNNTLNINWAGDLAGAKQIVQEAATLVDAPPLEADEE